MTHLTSSLPSRRPRCLDLFAGTAFPGRVVRISHVHRVALMTCRALRPRGRPTPPPKSRCRMVSSGQVKPSTIPQCTLTGLYHFSPKAYGLSPLCLRLTSRVTHTGSRLDTKCGGSPLPGRHFQPPANTAPRGAQLVGTAVRATARFFHRDEWIGRCVWSGRALRA